jgi:hypothetical protein
MILQGQVSTEFSVSPLEGLPNEASTLRFPDDGKPEVIDSSVGLDRQIPLALTLIPIGRTYGEQDERNCTAYPVIRNLRCWIACTERPKA